MKGTEMRNLLFAAAALLFCMAPCQVDAQELPKSATYTVTLVTDAEETNGTSFDVELHWLTNPGSKMAHDRVYASLTWFKEWLVLSNKDGGYDYIPIRSIKRIRVKQAFPAYPRIPIPLLGPEIKPGDSLLHPEPIKPGQPLTRPLGWELSVPEGPYVRLDNLN
jgi:hypothetical protein